ncbi:MAG: 2OG-Fe(II) oxygenase [Novosphingopyxis baekryungensis]|jgi:prolyl 4-hydroxylase|uniref:prolyl hydroxylase family protein n=1 Tax=Novosphingopyxis baekryungensis TaxID=279369 RepID=UPI0004125ABD|nr:2OG-Fe(II) oxygenase [Novosphingopyxis baekryungensis]MDE0932063.1 2OG-Fe(II) oxygenase [Novosphingopyxis baekryungensis]
MGTVTSSVTTGTRKRKLDPAANPAKLKKIGQITTRKLNANPYVQHVDVEGAQVYVYQNFLPAADCQLLIDRIDAEAVPSTLYEGTETKNFRTSYSCHLSSYDADVSRIENRMAEVLGIDNHFSETMQGQRYQMGQEFKPHHDFFHVGEGYWQQERSKGGQRSWTAMIFLNEVPEGGQTEFPQLGIGVEPKQGMMLIWNNMRPDGLPNMKTLHAGTPVKLGTKYVITKWFRQNNWLKLAMAD